MSPVWISPICALVPTLISAVSSGAQRCVRAIRRQRSDERGELVGAVLLLGRQCGAQALGEGALGCSGIGRCHCSAHSAAGAGRAAQAKTSRAARGLPAGGGPPLQL
jgi:hypothetical protein